MTEAKKLRRTSASGYARGDETRQRIIEAAIELFGERGFAGASTRDIAAHAGVNAPALQYYFENKEGVFRACADTIAELGCAAFGPALDHARAMLAREADVETLIESFLGIMHAISAKMFVTPKNAHQRMFFAREQAGLEPAIATEILMQRIRRPLHDVCTALVSRIANQPADSNATKIRAFSLLGQLSVFHMAQRSALAMLGWESYEGENGDLLRSVVAEQTRALLRQWHVEGQARAGAPRRALASPLGEAPAARRKSAAPKVAAKPAAKSAAAKPAAAKSPVPKAAAAKPAAPRASRGAKHSSH
ncbi:CerR family C-terminal domain-containing protein [Burkholderia sp. A1]|uniref:CerR family C-terminal domain-containing protein n=1 Tax=Burkholderia sp. A1 TaxID=148446 RepID=UPI000469506B|nr:CerR family C-terminal domain-containing protein [Burkholderia sp. A1]